MRYSQKFYSILLKWLPALVIASLIFVFSATPGKQVAISFEKLNTEAAQVMTPTTAQQSEDAPKQLLPKAIDWLKVGHVIGYFCLGVSVLFGVATYTRRSALSAQVICSLYAAADEFHQHFTPGRSASAQDILLDSAAACGGVVVLLVVVMIIQRFRSAPVGS